MGNKEYGIQLEGLTQEYFHLNKHNMAGALLEVRDQLKANDQEAAIRQWTNEGFAKFSDLIRHNNQSLEVLTYFVLLRLRMHWFKELLIAACYTIGVFLGPLSLAQAGLDLFQWLLNPQILLLALANLIIFSCFDYHSDRKDGHYSLAIHLGLSRTRGLAIGLVLMGITICVLLFFLSKLMIIRVVQLLICLMNLLLLMLLLREKQFRQHEFYRMVGDGIFFIPAIILLYAR